MFSHTRINDNVECTISDNFVIDTNDVDDDVDDDDRQYDLDECSILNNVNFSIFSYSRIYDLV